MFQDSEDWYTTFSSKIKCIYNDSFPLKLLSHKRQKDKPWITPGISNTKIDYIGKRSPGSQIMYMPGIPAIKMLQKCIREAETTYYSDLLNSCQNSSRQTWRHLSLMLNINTQSHSIKKLLYEERMLTNPADIGSTCLHVPNVPVGTSGCAWRVCLHRDWCARMQSAYPECPDPNLSAQPGQDGGCAVSLATISYTSCSKYINISLEIFNLCTK